MNAQITAAQSGTTLVIGANGKTGSRVANRLRTAGMRLRPASRSTEIPFDWTDAGSWSAALSGVSAAYITFHPDLAIPGAAETLGAFADVALQRGVRRLVLLSGRGEPGAQAAEALLQGSGADWTILRCAFFNQNFSELMLEPVRRGVMRMPAGRTAEPFLDADDIADVALAAFTHDRHIGQLYELTGPRLMTLDEVAAELSNTLERPVRYESVTTKVFADELAGEGVPREVADFIAQMATEVLDGRNAFLTDGVRRALGREPRDFLDYARKTAASGIWGRMTTAA